MKRILIHFVYLFIYGIQFGSKWWYRHACAAGGVGNVLLMMGANLVGFVLGVDGAQYFAHELIGSWAGTSSHFSELLWTSLIETCTVQAFASCLALVHACSLGYNLCSSTGNGVVRWGPSYR